MIPENINKVKDVNNNNKMPAYEYIHFILNERDNKQTPKYKIVCLFVTQATSTCTDLS